MIIFRSFTFIILVSSLSGQKEIDFNNLEKIENIFFIEGENIPADGSVYQYRNGKKEIMGIMKNGKKDGVWVEWHNYGRRLQETYKDGVLDGFVSIFYKNGQKEWRHTYNNGVLEGNYTRWHRNGKRAIDGFLRMEYQWVSGPGEMKRVTLLKKRHSKEKKRDF